MAFFKKVKCVECGFLVNEREISRIIEKIKKREIEKIIQPAISPLIIEMSLRGKTELTPYTGSESPVINEIKKGEKYYCLIEIIEAKREMGLDKLIKSLPHLLMSREDVEKPRKCEFFFSWLPGVPPEMHLISYLQEKIKKEKSFSYSKKISILEEAFRWLTSIISFVKSSYG